MKDCDRNDKKQLWECVGDKKYNIKRTQSSRYLQYGEYNLFVTINDTISTTPTTWKRLGSKKDVCSQGEILQVINNCEGKSKTKTRNILTKKLSIDYMIRSLTRPRF